MQGASNDSAVPLRFDLPYEPRFQIGTPSILPAKLLALVGIPFVRWRTVSKEEFLDKLMEAGCLSAKSDFDAVEVVFAAGDVWYGKLNGRHTLFRALGRVSK